MLTLLFLWIHSSGEKRSQWQRDKHFWQSIEIQSVSLSVYLFFAPVYFLSFAFSNTIYMMAGRLSKVMRFFCPHRHPVGRPESWPLCVFVCISTCSNNNNNSFDLLFVVDFLFGVLTILSVPLVSHSVYIDRVVDHRSKWGIGQEENNVVGRGSRID